MIDLDALVNGPVEATFGQACQYTPKGASVAIPITAAFFNGYKALQDGMPPPAQSTGPHLGVQLSQLLAMLPSYDAEAAQGDAVTVVGIGAFIVKSGQPDGAGWANLELQAAP